MKKNILTDEHIQKIKSLLGTLSQPQIAQSLGISLVHVRKAIVKIKLFDKGFYSKKIVGKERNQRSDNVMRYSEDVRLFCIEEWLGNNRSLDKIARIASRYFSIPIGREMVKKHLIISGFYRPKKRIKNQKSL
jgi:hypothetical protein